MPYTHTFVLTLKYTQKSSLTEHLSMKKENTKYLRDVHHILLENVTSKYKVIYPNGITVQNLSKK